jgi:ribosomal protein S18 acetylase RimI-like enzyme
VIVRRAKTIGDADAMARVHCASFAAAYGRERDPERTQESWRAAIGDPDILQFAAVDDEEIVGVLSVGPARDGTGNGELMVIYVHPNWWGTSAGQLLIERAHDVLAERFEEAVLAVLADNPRARRFYERNGWQLEEIRVEPHFGGTPTEIARYRKSLREP